MYTNGFHKGDLGSYPTYEEWKLRLQQVHQHCIFRSYPTYEEWKQSTSCCICDMFVSAGSYPTYEEWKHYNWYKC